MNNNRFKHGILSIMTIIILLVACNKEEDVKTKNDKNNVEVKLSPVSDRIKGEMIISYNDTDNTNSIFRFTKTPNECNWILRTNENEVIFDKYVSFEEGYFQTMSISYDSINDNFIVQLEDGDKVIIDNIKDSAGAVLFDTKGQCGTIQSMLQYDLFTAQSLFNYLLDYNTLSNNSKKIGPLTVILIGAGISLAVAAATTYITCKMQQKTEMNKCYDANLCAKPIKPCGAKCYDCNNRK